MDEFRNNPGQSEDQHRSPVDQNEAEMRPNAGNPETSQSENVTEGTPNPDMSLAGSSTSPVTDQKSDDASGHTMTDMSESHKKMTADNPSIEMPTVQRADFGDLDLGGRQEPSGGNIELLLDVDLPVAIELGRTQMSIKEILELGSGSVVELDKLAGEPVDILVNSRLLAKGEVVVLDENFGVRITSLVSPRERLENLSAS